ncbi:hypothetical protein AOT96_22290 [Rhodococcus sp. 008]|nr:hypothetical protein AOT96_22290 [Rhodococcus sp. 008]
MFDICCSVVLVAGKGTFSSSVMYPAATSTSGTGVSNNAATRRSTGGVGDRAIVVHWRISDGYTPIARAASSALW